MTLAAKYLRVPVSRLDELFIYDPWNGKLYWRHRPECPKGWNARYAGTEVRSPAKGGYFMAGIRVDGKSANYLVHRIAWAIMTGDWPEDEFEIDHRNGNRIDNSWCNLRKVKSYQNKMNVNACKSPTGYKGVTAPPHTRKYLASIRLRGKGIHIGYFHNARDAALAYDEAAIKYFGEFAKTNKQLGLL